MSEADLLRSARFRRGREADWRRLEAILDRVERGGLRALGFADARDMATLYRQAVNSLSVAREISLDAALLDYLENLCARSYLAVYAPRRTLRGLVGRFLSAAPAAMRRSAQALLLAATGMGLGALVGYLLYLESSDWFYVFVPEAMGGGRHPGASAEELRSVIYGGADQEGGALAAFAAFLFSHNTTIAIFAFSLGVFACLPSLALLFYNGLLIGAFVALHVEKGLGPDIAGWLSIHGVTELSAIVVAGAAGFRLGLAVLFPGRLSRRHALAREGRDALLLALIAAMMLIVAAALEGFGRQLVQDTGQRLFIGWGVGGLWLSWFLLGGRRA